MTPLVSDIIAIIGAITALVVALPALIIAIKGQGDHKVNAANITAAKETADSALSQSAQALLNTPGVIVPESAPGPSGEATGPN